MNADDNGITIIENTQDARSEYGYLSQDVCDEHGYLFGGGDQTITRSQIKALLSGKVLAFNDGEYVQYLVYAPNNNSSD